jgi:hypothetical protein
VKLATEASKSTEAPSSDEVVDIPDNVETNTAASKLQAIHRGKQARAEVSAMKTEHVGACFLRSSLT